MKYPYHGGGLILLAVLLFAMPQRLEGPVLVPISPGHGLSLLDMVALVPLLVGSGILKVWLWKQRGRLYEVIRLRPTRAVAAVFLAGVGLGLLVASSFASFFWWWAIGAGLLAAVVVAAMLAVSQP